MTFLVSAYLLLIAIHTHREILSGTKAHDAQVHRCIVHRIKIASKKSDTCVSSLTHKHRHLVFVHVWNTMMHITVDKYDANDFVLSL